MQERVDRSEAEGRRQRADVEAGRKDDAVTDAENAEANAEDAEPRSKSSAEDAEALQKTSTFTTTKIFYTTTQHLAL